MSRRRRPSLLGALLWVGLGLLFLLRNFGVGPDIWLLAGRYWPVLLILLGAGKVVDYFLQKDAISIRFGEIIGILLLLLVGTAISKISEGHIGRIVRGFPIEIGGVRPGQWIGESHTYSEEATYPLDYSMPIHIENSYGSVSVAPGSDREIRVRLKKEIYAGESRARGIAGQIHLEAARERISESPAQPRLEAEPGMKPDGECFMVRTNRDTLSSKDYTFNTDMEVFVPKDSQVQVRNMYGEVRVAEISGNLDLRTTHRTLEVQDCSGQFTISTLYAECRLTDLVGNLNIDSRSRGRVYIENIRGDVRVTNEYSPMEISNVDGKLTVSSTEGSLRIEKIAKSVVIDARGTKVQAADLKGGLKVTASHGRVNISDVVSDVTLKSDYAAVALKDIRGNIEIQSNSDRVSADDIRGNLTLNGRASSVRLNGISGGVDIQTTLKDVIVNDLAGSCAITDEYADVSVSARNPLKAIQIKNLNAGIDLFLPEEASFGIDATARNGKIESDYAGLEPSGNEGNVSILRSKAKSGGSMIRLETEYGNIHIHQSNAGRISIGVTQ